MPPSTRKTSRSVSRARPLRSSPRLNGVSRYSEHFSLENHRLIGHDVRYLETPNIGAKIVPRYLVFHYTAGRNFQSSVDWLTNPLANASAHLIVGRKGQITQLAPFTTKTWHAGQSAWNGLSGLNQYAIGVEMDNAGPLHMVGTRLQAWFGKTYPKNQALQAIHKFETEPRWWHAFTEVQIFKAIELAKVLFHAYGLQEILGHDDIAPSRKRDPGPAFPLSHIQSLMLGRKNEEEERFIVTASALNIRMGPGSEHDRVSRPLKKGTLVLLLEKKDRWAKVLVERETRNANNDLEGWVYNRYIVPWKK